LIDLIDLGHHIDNISPEHLWHLEKIKLSQARERGLGTGKGIKVAVLDTGINGSHPELRGKVTISYDKYMHKLSNPEDTDGHGTQVASLICGNTIGVAPDVKIIDVVLLERKYGKLVDFIWVLSEILKYHTDVPVVNISGGLYHSHKDHEDPRLHTLIQRFSDKQIFLVVAAGNRGVGKTISPGIFREVISVGATTKNDEVWKKSGGDKLVDSKGEYTVPDLVAPGASIYVPAKQGGFERVSGTSMAAPIVSGIIALLIEKFRNTYNYFTVDDVLEEMYKTCVDLQLPRERQGKGLVAFSG
jgi:subtilisin family serine protease